MKNCASCNSNSVSKAEATKFFQELSEDEKTACSCKFSIAVRATHEKLSKYMTAEG